MKEMIWDSEDNVREEWNFSDAGLQKRGEWGWGEVRELDSKMGREWGEMLIKRKRGSPLTG